MFVTASGGVKRTALSEFAEASGRQNGIAAMKLAADDRVVAVFPGWDDYELLLVTANGQGIRFAEDDVRPVGRSAGGIRGIRLKGDDRVIGACAAADGEIVVIATEQGFAKRTEVDEFPVQARGGSGLKAAKIDKARGKLVAVRPRPTRSRSSQPMRASSCPARACAPRRATAAVRRCAPTGLQRVVAVAPPRADALIGRSYGAGFSTVFQSRVVRYVRKCSPTLTRSSIVFGCRSS